MQKISEIQAFECKCAPEECREIKKKANEVFEILNDRVALGNRQLFSGHLAMR